MNNKKYNMIILGQMEKVLPQFQRVMKKALKVEADFTIGVTKEPYKFLITSSKACSVKVM